jgi:predicted phosphodiesterase
MEVLMKTVLGLFLVLASLLPAGAQTKPKAGALKPSGDFTFLVMGDSRGAKPMEISEKFKAALQEANVLAPDFVVNSGDLIMGYTADTSEIHMEWNAFQLACAELKVPLYLVAGNHDIQNKTDQEYFLKNNPRGLYYSFDHKGSHFVVLNSEDLDHPDSIAGKQWEWLKNDLAKARGADGIYLFLHKPLWAIQEKGTANAWMGLVHPLLKARVKGVFAGHWHQYQFEERDGIKYYVSGGAGAPLYRGLTPETGGFYHYLLVRVKSGTPHVGVVKTGSVLPEDVISSQDVERSKALRLRVFGNPHYYLPPRPGFKDEVTIPVNNILGVPIEGTVVWRGKKGGLAFVPEETRFSVPAGGSTSLTFKVKGKGAYAYPSPEAAIAVAFGSEGKTVKLEKALRWVESYDCLKAKKTPKIDGDLKDWSGVPRLTLNDAQRARFTPPEAWKGPKDCSARFLLCWDEKNLYLAVEGTDDAPSGKVQKDAPFRGDGVILLLDAGVGFGRFLRDTTTASTVQIGFHSNARPPYLYGGLRFAKPRVAEEVEAKAVRDLKGNLLLYEAAIPWSLLAEKAPKVGDVYLLNLAVSDNDGQGRKGWLEWSPGGLEEDDFSCFGELRLK